MRRVVSLFLLAAVTGCGSADVGGNAAPASTSTTAAATSVTDTPTPTPPPVTTPPAGTAPPATSTAASTGVPPAGELTGRTVVVDPGHNGANGANPRVVNALVPAGRGRTKPCNTTGSETNAGYAEHAFNWDVAVRLRDLLTARGAEVVLTRSDDKGVGPCVDKRAAAGNAPGVDAVVSIHADGSSPQARGFHVAYSDPPLNGAQGAPAMALATAVRDAMSAAGFTPAGYIGSAGLDGRDDLAGLNLAENPAVLVECANLRNPTEAATVSSPDGRARYAAAIADGVTRFLRS